jgi:phenylacetate-CoA ligase
MTGRDLAGRAVLAAMDVSRSLRPALRESERHYAAGRRFRRLAAGWGDARRSMWILDRLRHVVRGAAHTPFYRDRFRSVGFDPASDFTFDDVARIPILERTDVIDHAESMRTGLVAAHQLRRDSTGGSTGIPLAYWSGPEERGWRLSGQHVFLEGIGIPRWASTAFLWGHHIDKAERDSWRDRVRDALTSRRWFDCFRMSPEVLLDYHRELTRFRPACLVAYASALDALASVLIENGLTATYPTARLVTGAEKLWPAQRERIERAFPVPVHERYGSRELGQIAGQHDPSRTLDLDVDWANVLVEPEGPSGVEPIIVTKLHADAMPFIRYRIGDVARFPAGSQPGHPVFHLEDVLGRSVDGLHTPDGRWLNGLGIPHLLKDFAIREFQVLQHADFSVQVFLVPASGYTAAEGDRVLGILAGNLPGLSFRIEAVPDIPRSGSGKWRPVMTHAVPRGRPGTSAAEPA